MTRKRLNSALAVGAVLGLGLLGAKPVGDAIAQGSGSGSGSGTSTAAATAQGDASPSSKAFTDINAKMHKGMDITFTGDADVDFARGMIPHHVGAVEMAQVVLKYGKDPDLKKLAEEIVKAQEAEIVFMRAWLQKMGK